MPELLREPRRAARVRAVDPDRALVLDDGRAADRAGRRHLVLALRAGPTLRDRTDDLRDDVAGLLEDDPVADPDVLATNLVEVVEGGARDSRPRDLDRRHVRHRRQRPGPSDVRDDVLDEGLDLLWRELEGDRPARSPADHPEPRLLVDAVDLDHDAIGLVREVVALLAPELGEVDDTLDVEIRGVLRVHRKAERPETRQCLRLGRHRVAVLDQLVEPGRQLPTRRDLRVDLAERTRAAVARVGVEREAGFLALLVDALELGLGHEHLAPRLERGGLLQSGRDDRDRLEVRGDVLAGRAVTAGRTLDETATLEPQTDRQAVDLELGAVAQVRGGLGRSREARDPCARARRTRAARRG